MFSPASARHSRPVTPWQQQQDDVFFSLSLWRRWHWGKCEDRKATLSLSPDVTVIFLNLTLTSSSLQQVFFFFSLVDGSIEPSCHCRCAPINLFHPNVWSQWVWEGGVRAEQSECYNHGVLPTLELPKLFFSFLSSVCVFLKLEGLVYTWPKFPWAKPLWPITQSPTKPGLFKSPFKKQHTFLPDVVPCVFFFACKKKIC